MARGGPPKKGGYGGIPFGRMFDFNRDGRLDFAEKWVAFKVFEEISKNENSTYRYNSSDTYHSTESNTAWRDTCEDGSEYGLDPEDFDTEEEYEDALEQARTAWRDTCEDGSEYDLDPEDFDTEEEYEEALAEARTAWRDTCEDGSEYDLDPEDFDTEEEYEDALEQARTAWRDTCEDGGEYGLDPEDFDTEEEYEDALEQARTAWRDTCEDGSEYGLDPEDFDTEEEYEEALEEARIAWRDTCEDGSEYDLDPEDFDTEEEYEEALEQEEQESDATQISISFSVEFPALDKLEQIKEENYPNRRRYQAAYELANEFVCYSDPEYEQWRKSCCRFIIDKADTVTAANYLSCDSGFLYAQAIKDNFSLPVSLPDEDDHREFSFSEALCKIAKRNAALSFEVWEWGLETFLPYTRYAADSASELTSEVIGDLFLFPTDYRIELVRYMDKHPAFLEKVMTKDAEMPDNLDALIVTALEEGLEAVALALFWKGLMQADNDWRKINALTRGTISWCKNDEELESAEYFKCNMLPLVRVIDIGMVQDEIEQWEEDLDEYISQMEDTCERYAYTRKNAWRKTVPDGSLYGLDPIDHACEQEYLEQLREAKHRRQEREKRESACRQERWNIGSEEVDDATIYTVCGVSLYHTAQPYHYLTDDSTLKIGDSVIVPVGDREARGRIVSVGQYLSAAAPFPVSKMKRIKGRATDEANG